MNYRAIKFDENPLLRPGLPIGRSRLMQWLLLFVLFLLIARAFYIQFFQDEFLQRKGESLYKRTIETPPVRGSITDRQDKLLALSTPVKSVWMNPNEIRRIQEGSETEIDPMTETQLMRLSQLLAISPNEIKKRMGEKSEFLYLRRQISPEIADQIEQMNIGGIYTQPEFRRYYPGGEVMAHVVGFVGIDGQGQEGLELAFQPQLAGRAGLREVLRDRKGRIVEEIRQRSAAVDGMKVVLTLDSTIQYFAYSRIKEAVDKHQARSGSVIVMDIENGHILALVNYPSFNPNNRETFTTERLRNRAVTDMFEPGSVMKPFTIALALEKKLVKPDTVIDLRPGYLQFGARRIRDVHPADQLSVRQIISKSNNVGTAKIAAMMDNPTLWKMLTTLNFGQPTPLELPGEAGGMLAKPEQWRPVDKAVISYGHGISMTLIQLASAYTVFGRNGTFVHPTILLGNEPKIGQKVFSESTIKVMQEILEQSTQPGSTGVLAATSGYRVGGKTGTARKIENRQYTRKYHSSFVGIGPMSRPKLVVAVTIDEPVSGSYYAGRVVGPVFSDVMGNALRQLGVRPDAPQSFTHREVDLNTIAEGV